MFFTIAAVFFGVLSLLFSWVLLASNRKDAGPYIGWGFSVGLLFAALGWQQAMQAEKEMRTLEFLQETRLSSAYSDRVIEINRLYPTSVAGLVDDPEDVQHQNLRWIIGYLDLIAMAIERGELDEDVMRDFYGRIYVQTASEQMTEWFKKYPDAWPAFQRMAARWGEAG